MLTELFKLGLPLFFASPAVLPADGGAPADTGGGGADSPGTGTDAGDETPGAAGRYSDSDGEGDNDSDRSSPDAERVSDETADSAQRDGRSVPHNIKQALAELKKLNPQAAETLRREWYTAGDYKQVYPTVQEARDARDLIESIGGSDGITNMQQEVSDYSAELTRMAQGDPVAVEELAKDFPEGLVKLVPHAVSKMQQINPEAYEHFSAGIAANILRDKGVAGSLLRVAELISDGKQKESLDLAQKLIDWVKTVDEFGKQKPKSNDEHPEVKRAKELQAELNARDKAQFGANVGRQAIETMHKSMDTYLQPLMKGKKLTQEQINDLRNGIRTEVSNGLASRQGYKQRVQGFIDAGDEKGLIRFLNGQYQVNDLVKKSVAKVWARRGFANAPARQAANGNGAARTAPGTKPPAEQIDWSKDRDRTRYALGQATLKDGRVARWNWDDV